MAKKTGASRLKPVKIKTLGDLRAWDNKGNTGRDTAIAHTNIDL